MSTQPTLNEWVIKNNAKNQTKEGEMMQIGINMMMIIKKMNQM